MFAHEILFQPKNPCFPDMFRGAGSGCESPHARVWRSPKQELASPIKMQRSIREPPVACFRDAATPANGRLDLAIFVVSILWPIALPLYWWAISGPTGIDEC
jgi:hypothetical protein